MIDVGLEAILIMDKAGIPLLFQELDPKRSDIEPILFSGFLTALKAFSSTLIDETAKDFQLDYGKRLVTILTGHDVIFAAIHNRKSTDQITPLLSPLLNEFEKNYFKKPEILGESGPLEQYFPFRERIASVMGISNPSLDWIPFVSKNHDHNIIMNSILLNLINNQDTIKEIIKKSKHSKSEVLKEISKLWAYNQIKFRNVLTKEDIVISTNKTLVYLQPSTQEWKELSYEFPNLINTVPFVISHLDGKTTVGNVLQDFRKEGTENVYWLMDYLYINGVISILTPEKRRILMAKEILEKSLDIATKVYSTNDVLAKLKNILSEIKIPEIISQIRIGDKRWNIDFSFLIYEGLSPEKVLKLYENWLEILRLFIFSLEDKKRKAFIIKLTEELNYDFFDKYRSEDFDGFEEFAFWLEVIFN